MARYVGVDGADLRDLHIESVGGHGDGKIHAADGGGQEPDRP